MLDDPRIKRVLKRYKKGDQFSDASVDVSSYGDRRLLEACQCEQVDDLASPRELDSHALAHLAKRMGIEFDNSQFDYFLHSYVRSEFFESYYDDPTVTSTPAPEGGPPAKIPLEKGMRWCSVRPKDDQERYEAYEIDDAKEEG